MIVENKSWPLYINEGLKSLNLQTSLKYLTCEKVTFFSGHCLLQEEAISSKTLCPVAPGLTKPFMQTWGWSWWAAPRSDPGDSPALQASLLRPELCVSIFVKMVIYSNPKQGPKILNSNSSLINYKPYVIFKTWTCYMVQSMQFKCGKSNVDELIIYLMCVKGGSSKEIFYKRSLL